MGYRQTELVDNNYYHVYSRGNEKRSIFIAPKDYSRFLDRLKKYSQQDKIGIICYCLMPNHYHLLLQQLQGGSISNFIQRLQVSYAMYFNIKNKRVGHLFQGPFKAKLIEDDSYMLQVSKYIHLNPKDINEEPSKYRWSSLRSYLGQDRSDLDHLLGKKAIYEYYEQPFYLKAYKDFVFSKDEIPEEILIQD